MDGTSRKMQKAKSSDEVSSKAAGTVEFTQDNAKCTLDEAAMTPFLREITLVSSGGAFLDGYVLSLIGVALTQITTGPPSSARRCCSASSSGASWAAI